MNFKNTSNPDNPSNASKQHNSHLDGFASQAKGKTGIKRIINAGKFSVDGLKAAFANEAAFRQLTFLHTALLLIVAVCPFALMVKMVLVFASVFSLVVELFNTGLEAAIDHTSTDKHPLAKIGKDVGSAAQFLTLSLLFVLWAMALWSL